MCSYNTYHAIPFPRGSTETFISTIIALTADGDVGDKVGSVVPVV